MDTVHKLFFQSLKASLLNTSVNWSETVETKDWLKLFQLAEKHHILPMIFEAVYNCSAAKQMDPQLFMSYKRKTVQMVGQCEELERNIF